MRRCGHPLIDALQILIVLNTFLLGASQRLPAVSALHVSQVKLYATVGERRVPTCFHLGHKWSGITESIELLHYADQQNHIVGSELCLYNNICTEENNITTRGRAALYQQNKRRSRGPENMGHTETGLLGKRIHRGYRARCSDNANKVESRIIESRHARRERQKNR